MIDHPSARHGQRGERRRSSRAAVQEQIEWRIARGRRTHSGLVVERSLDGFAFLTAAPEAPPDGARIYPVIRRTSRHPLAIRSARIVHAQSVTSRVRLVGAEIEA